MIALTHNVASFEKELAQAFAVLEAKMSVKYYTFTQEVFKSIVVTSPQWSGNLASNWNYSINAPDTSYVEAAEKKLASEKFYDAYEVGSNPAVGRSIARAAAAAVPSWRTPVYITNTTPSDQAGYLVEEIAGGKVKLRPVNMVPAQGAIIGFTVDKFKGAIL
jgi:hypothetical protein